MNESQLPSDGKKVIIEMPDAAIEDGSILENGNINVHHLPGQDVVELKFTNPQFKVRLSSQAGTQLAGLIHRESAAARRSARRSKMRGQ